MTIYINLKGIAKAVAAGVIVVMIVMGFAGFLFKEYRISCPPKCAENNTAEILQKVQESKMGFPKDTGALCLGPGLSLNSTEVSEKTGTSDAIVFACSGLVCKGLNVSAGYVTAEEKVMFRAESNCARVVNNYNCAVTIKDY